MTLFPFFFFNLPVTRTSLFSNLSSLIESWSPQNYSVVVNGRFKGGYITRFYGAPSENIDSLQLEISQATYMDEDSLAYDDLKADKLISTLEELFDKLIAFSVKSARKY